MDMALKETIKLEISSVLGLEQIAMDTAASFARIMGFSKSRIENLKTAIGEACINAIEHGNKYDSNINVVIKMTGNCTKLQVDVYDQGKGIQGPIQKPDIHAKVSDRQSHRGWGLFLIQNLMDEVQFKTDTEFGNLTRMIIYLKQKPEQIPKGMKKNNI